MIGRQLPSADSVAETVCDGPLKLQFAGHRATISFTHLRAKTAPLFGVWAGRYAGGRTRIAFRAATRSWSATG
jgi:hypothetical protein